MDFIANKIMAHCCQGHTVVYVTLFKIYCAEAYFSKAIKDISYENYTSVYYFVKSLQVNTEILYEITHDRKLL